MKELIKSVRKMDPDQWVRINWSAEKVHNKLEEKMRTIFKNCLEMAAKYGDKDELPILNWEQTLLHLRGCLMR
jgi:glutamate dehydrogenase/leucine dehydrogenase